MSQPFKLYRLQQVDSQLDQARARVQKIAAILNDDALLKTAEGQFGQSQNELQQARRDLKHAEEEVQVQRIKLEQTEASLYGGKIHNPKELQDLQKESVSLKKLIGVLEDRQIENMILVEDAEAAHRSASEELEKVKAQVAASNAHLIEEQNRLLSDIDLLQHNRQATVSTISSEDLKLYEQLRQQRGGIAVAKVTENACAACGSTLTPAQNQASHSPNQISRCTFCGRILYAG